MAAPIIPIIKKVASKIASSVASSKKGRKGILWVIGIVLVLILMPIIALLGIFGGGVKISLDNVNGILQQEQVVISQSLTEITDSMTEQGYGEQRIEEAQAVYMLVLFDRNNEEKIVERYVGCYALEQTDRELISNINDEFGTKMSIQEFTDIVQEIRDKYEELEKENNEENKET